MVGSSIDLGLVPGISACVPVVSRTSPGRLATPWEARTNPPKHGHWDSFTIFIGKGKEGNAFIFNDNSNTDAHTPLLITATALQSDSTEELIEKG